MWNLTTDPPTKILSWDKSKDLSFKYRNNEIGNLEEDQENE